MAKLLKLVHAGTKRDFIVAAEHIAQLEGHGASETEITLSGGGKPILVAHSVKALTNAIGGDMIVVPG